MKKIAAVAALALLMLASPAFAAKDKPTHPPVPKHHMDKSKIGKHVKPNHATMKHKAAKHPTAVHPTNPHLKQVKPHKAKKNGANKAAVKASSKKSHKFHLF